ncbi:MAG: hypothetical protein IT159_14935, partial [Bryobacterales bacterium]|nr:hypothetical protein [Bryobacterales bacterium]
MSHKNPTRFLGSQTSLTLLVSLLVVGMLPAPARGDDPIPGYLNQIEASRLTTVASDLTTLYGPRRHDTYSPYTGANCVISSTVYPKS